MGDACKNTVGTQELDYLNDLQIYPNPGDESVFVRMGSDRSRKISLELYDVFGRQRQQQTISVFAGQSSTYSLATWQLPAGMYYLVLKDEQRVRAQQLVIAH
nr:T9SS type A sorting domain-containing protein [Flavilitoribacter nigricans]